LPQAVAVSRGWRGYSRVDQEAIEFYLGNHQATRKARTEFPLRWELAVKKLLAPDADVVIEYFTGVEPVASAVADLIRPGRAALVVATAFELTCVKTLPCCWKRCPFLTWTRPAPSGPGPFTGSGRLRG